MRKIVLMLLAATILTELACPVLVGPAEEAAAAASESVARFRTADFKVAVKDSWDLDGALVASFGLFYINLTPEQKNRAQAALVDVIATPLYNPRLKALLEGMNVTGAKAAVFSENSVMVILTVVSDEGKWKSTETLLMNRTAAGWKIVDQQLATGLPLRVGISGMYNDAKLAADSPAVYSVLEKIAADMRKQKR